MLSIAAEDSSISGVIAQVPHCDARLVAKSTPLSQGLKALGHGLWDLLKSCFGGQHRVPIVGKPGAGFSVLHYPGWYEQYLLLSQNAKGWVNQLPARSLLRGSQYSPVDTAASIRCPVLIMSGRNDQGVPRESVTATVARIPNCQHIEYDMDHFDCYDGWDLNATVVADQCAFLREQLALA